MYKFALLSRINICATNLLKAFKKRRAYPIVCTDIKLVYYPIPKVASSSIKDFLTTHCSEISRGNSHVHMNIYPQLSMRRALKLREFTSFAVVRNPYDRIVSCYKNKITDRRLSGEGLESGFIRYNQIFGRNLFRLDMSFREFLNIISKIPDTLSDEHFRSQICFIPSANQPRALDYIHKMEELDEQMNLMLKRIAFQGSFQSDVNVSYRTNKKEYTLNKEEINLINKRYKQDLAFLDYEVRA